MHTPPCHENIMDCNLNYHKEPLVVLHADPSNAQLQAQQEQPCVSSATLCRRVNCANLKEWVGPLAMPPACQRQMLAVHCMQGQLPQTHAFQKCQLGLWAYCQCHWHGGRPDAQAALIEPQAHASYPAVPEGPCKVHLQTPACCHPVLWMVKVRQRCRCRHTAQAADQSLKQARVPMCQIEALHHAANLVLD